MNKTKQSTVAEEVELACTTWRRFMGLMGREPLPSGRALLLEPCSGIHMCFMKFALDVVFLDSDDRVVRIVRGLAPWRTASARGSRKVVEMTAGTLCEDISEGDELQLE